MEERWKAIPGCPEFEFSNLGNARNAFTHKKLYQYVAANGKVFFQFRSQGELFETWSIDLTKELFPELAG
jgi:hypothetical protein